MLSQIYNHLIAPRLGLFWAKLTAGADGARAFAVVAENMSPTIESREIVWFRPHKNFSDITRGTVVAATHSEFGGMLVPSRVVGLPGDSVEISGGDLLINDTRVPEPYVFAERAERDYSQSSARVVVPEGTLWLLGDFRDMSKDSRFIGPFPASQIAGVVFKAHRVGEHKSPRVLR